MNTIKTGLLMAALTALFIVCGNALGGTTGVIIAVAFALVMNIGAFWFSDKLVLAMTKAQPLDERAAPDLYAMTRRLAERAQIPMPKLYVVPDPSPNAFATGRSPSRGVVAVNQGLLQMLDRDEVEGVIAHEIAHIKHRDTLTSAVVATVAGAISAIANLAYFASFFGFGSGDDDGPNPLAVLLLVLVAPLAATIIQLAVSRAREYQADQTAAELVGSPRGLQSALWKLHKGAEGVPSHTPPAMAQMCIVNPLHGGIQSLFSTHPPVEKRIERLAQFSRNAA
ncbi:MAG TPA: zinc metalloprotease HtpX [Fimbriimonadaceae bacterium]|nr:zinc metalloprotease HtpX [Fimbriimonadaceae bacterium]HRJ96721.1 zinc metalloprotease HtpX [Fimbriimonadaceae bacterium]